ncbi:MAG: phage tail tube protein [Oscillospiraceae bacterium]|jgi:hypothetical protein|nr:phage tail tube protein [Oscillospiraceae bacterium]
MAVNQLKRLDTRKVMTGKDGRLFVTNKAGAGLLLAEVEQFVFTANFTNVTRQGVGTIQTQSIPASIAYTLTFTETVVRDDVLVTEMLDSIKNGFVPFFDFQGALSRFDGQESRVVLRECIPDGSVNLMNVVPGEILKREWTFAVNDVPEWLKTLTA